MVIVKATALSLNERGRDAIANTEIIGCDVTLHSRYELFESLGGNHFCEVFRARDHHADRWVAVMQLHPRLRSDPGAWETIWEGVVLRAGIKHEYCVAVYDLVKEPGWIVTEYMEGNIKLALPQAALPADSVRTVLRRSLQALDWLHGKGQLHGDIRPANLLFDREGAVKLSFSPGLTVGDAVPHQARDFKYIAPEMLADSFGPIGPGVDLYCLGVSSLEALAPDKLNDLVKGAIDAPDPALAWMRWHSSAQAAFPSVRTLVPACPGDIAAVIDRLLAKTVTARYPSATAALAGLDAAQDDKPIATEALVKLASQENSDTRQVVANDPVIARYVPAGAPSTPVGAAATTPALAGKPVRPQSTRGSAPGAVKTTVNSASTAPRWSKEWINEKLSNPWVMAAVVVLLLLPVGLTAAAKYAPGRPALARVPLHTDPPGARIMLDGKAHQQLTNTELELAPGSYLVHLEKEGYEPRDHKFTVAAAGAQPAQMVRLAKISAAPPQVVASDEATKPKDAGESKEVGDPKIDESEDNRPQLVKEDEAASEQTQPADLLPQGLVPVGDERVPDRDLPLRVTFQKLSSLSDGARPLELVYVPAGDFIFGVDGERFTGELPQTQATIEQPFYIATTEVTRAHFQAFLKAANLPPASFGDGGGSPNLPQTNVSHELASRFCQWLSSECTLPTEQQWERAGRGDQGRMLPWTTEREQTFDGARSILRPASGAPALAPVASKPDGAATIADESSAKVFDLVGNAAEWCRDKYTAGEGDDAQSPGVGTHFVIRGASYLEIPGPQCRLTWRANGPPEGAPDIGFRVVVSLGSQQP